MVAKGAPALEEIRLAFGDTVIDRDGLLDRSKMRELVFADIAQRRKLEAIVHPRIRDATLAQAAEIESGYMIIVVPLLVESPLKEFVDRVLVVDCSETTQFKRLMARDADSEAQARRIIASQASREARLQIADDIVQNDGDLDATRRATIDLHARYLELASGPAR